MVKKIFILLLFVLLFESCAFFGSSIFPQAMSQDLSWALVGNKKAFYILENGLGDELLFYVFEYTGSVRVLIFDTSLNIRGYLEDGADGASTDGIGFVDHYGDFIIGQTKIAKTGNTEEIQLVPVPGLGINRLVYRTIDPDTSIKHFIQIDNAGNGNVLNELFADTASPTVSLPFGINGNIHQSDSDLSSLFYYQGGSGLYEFSKSDLFRHIDGSVPIASLPALISVSEPNLSQWVTRCSKGFFVSNDEGTLFLFGPDGSLIKTIENNNYHGNVVTIDYGCEFYYIINESKGRIIKERLLL